MQILKINTISQPNFVEFCGQKIAWEGRASSETISNIEKVLDDKKPDIIAVYQGQAGFTSARIGVTIANCLAEIWQIKIVEICSEDDEKNLENLPQKNEISPYYAFEPNITKPKCSI